VVGVRATRSRSSSAVLAVPGGRDRRARVPGGKAPRRRHLQAGVRTDSRWPACVLLPVKGPAQDVAATTSPLAAVRTAPIVIATRGEVASAAKPAISAPATKPKSRQKR